MPRVNQSDGKTAMIRRSCALMGLLALFLQGSNGGHMLLVEHRQCAEHGGLVHGGEAHVHESHAPSTTEASAAVGAHEEGADDSHEHCLLCADRRATAAAGSVSVAIEMSARSAAPPPQTADELAGPPLYRTAPKNSPPA
jgi:hypothetical protein